MSYIDYKNQIVDEHTKRVNNKDIRVANSLFTQSHDQIDY